MPIENCRITDIGYEKNNQAFLTDRFGGYASEAKDARNRIISRRPPLGDPSKVINISKIREVVTEDLRVTNHKIVHLKKTEVSEKIVTMTFKDVLCRGISHESFETIKKAETFLNPYLGKYLSEMQARELIHQAGMRTFPRPKGIPENFRIKLSDRGCGMKYVDPENLHISIRVMPGKPHSPFPCQREPYVIHTEHGKMFDKFGNRVNSDSPEAHIPIKYFIYRQ